MEKKYSKKEHDKCQRVADAFSELYEMYGDMCVVDAGKFGFAFLKWYGGESFDGIVFIRTVRNCLMICGRCG